MLLWLGVCSFIASLRPGAGALTTADAAKWALAESSVFDIQSEMLEPWGNKKKSICHFFIIIQVQSEELHLLICLRSFL